MLIYSYKQCSEICKQAYDLGTDGIKFINLISTGRAESFENYGALSYSEIQEFLDCVDSERMKYNKEEFCIRRGGTFGRGKSKNFYCPAGSNSVVITPQLNVYPCIFLAKPGYEIVYVKDDKVMVEDGLEYNDSECLAKRLFN